MVVVVGSDNNANTSLLPKRVVLVKINKIELVSTNRLVSNKMISSFCISL